MNRLVLSTLVAAGIAAVAPNAQSQTSMLSGFQIGAAGGVAFPTGQLGDFSNTGYNVSVMVGVKPALLPVGVRLEAAYNQFGLQGADGNVNIPAFTGNLTFALPMAGLSPYAIGGAGLYRTNVDQTGFESEGQNRFGFNVGGGIKIPFSSSFETFIEARYNRVNTDNGNLSFVPVTIGVMF